MVHNSYGGYSGEEAVVDRCIDLLIAKGHTVHLFAKSSRHISKVFLGKVRAFFSGIFSIKARRQFRQALDQIRPQIVHVHNLYPLISPSILPECRKVGVPVVMTVHNYRLLCPNAMQMSRRDGRHCRMCKGGREYWCILKDCEASLPRSIGYAARNYIAWRYRLFVDHVWLYACLAHAQMEVLVDAGYPPERMEVLGNIVEPIDSIGHTHPGRYVAFAGRVSPEKGIKVLLEAARSCQDIPFRIAGNIQTMPDILGLAPANCRFLGHIDPEKMPQFYSDSRMVVVPSLWHEPFGLSAAEAQAHAKPVVCSRIGALPEIVVDEVTGLLFEPGDAAGLAAKIRYLWARPELCLSMGKAGWQRTKELYGPERYYQRLVGVYQKAISLGPPQCRSRRTS